MSSPCIPGAIDSTSSSFSISPTSAFDPYRSKSARSNCEPDTPDSPDPPTHILTIFRKRQAFKYIRSLFNSSCVSR